MSETQDSKAVGEGTNPDEKGSIKTERGGDVTGLVSVIDKRDKTATHLSEMNNKKHELSDRQRRTLKTIRKYPDETQTEIADRMGLTAAQVSYALSTDLGVDWDERHSAVEEYLNEEVENAEEDKWDLTEKQKEVLKLVRENPGAGQREIAEKCEDDIEHPSVGTRWGGITERPWSERVEVVNEFFDDVDADPSEAKYICDECGFECETSQGLSSHKRVHEDSEHVCEVCGNTFGSKAGLTSHKQTHAEDSSKADTGEKTADNDSEELGMHSQTGVARVTFEEGDAERLYRLINAAQPADGEWLLKQVLRR